MNCAHIPLKLGKLSDDDYGFCSEPAWIPVLALPLSSCVNLGKGTYLQVGMAAPFDIIEATTAT